MIKIPLRQKREKEVRHAERFIRWHREGRLTDPRDIKHALSLKWFRLRSLYYIKDKNGKKVKFNPNRAQRERYVNAHFWDLILKARQLGFTTFEMIDSLDDCVFKKQFKVGCIAHTLKDAKSIFNDKVKYAYDQVPDSWIAVIKRLGIMWPTIKSQSVEHYEFTNGSKIEVSTSYRGGTLQRLHVSEFGKICARRPDVAQEIVTGAFEAVGQGNRVTIESTAEGAEGYFYQYAREAENLQTEGKHPGIMDWNFHFYPWWEEPTYRTDPAEVDIPQWLRVYFERLAKEEGINTDAEQQAWYALKALRLQDKIKREYPSTPKEAFEQNTEGAYYARQMAQLRANGMITNKVRYNPGLPVYTAWDLGMSDSMCIWFVQVVGREVHAIDYLEDSGEGMAYYARKLQEKGYTYGGHYGPHDLAVRELGGDGKSRAEMAQQYGIKFQIVPRVANQMEGIEKVRQFLPMCWFSSTECEQGIKCLDNYRKEWDEKHGVYKDRPRHDWASHGSKAFETLARSKIIAGFSAFAPGVGQASQGSTQNWGAFT